MYQILLSEKTYKSLNSLSKLFAALLLVFYFSEVRSQCPHALPFTEDFATAPLGACSGTHGGWTSTTVASGASWWLPNTNYAGGAAPEAEAYGDQANGGVSETVRLISPSLNTVGVSSVTLSFKQQLYLTNSGASGSGTITVKVESSPDNSVWTQQYSAGFSATPSLTSVLHETRTITVNGLSSNTFYFRFSVSGVLFKLWGWEIDDVSVTGTVAPVPTITNFTPTSACSASGATVTITGTNFTGASAVNFNGTSASFSVTSATEISAILPAGATTGVITVVTGGGTATSATNFTVNPTPTATATPGVQATCSGDNVNIALSSNVNGTTYSWTRTTPSGISGTMPTSGTTDPSGTLINSNAGSTTVNFSITPSTANCTGTATSANVVVQPLPATPGSISGTASVCSGSANTYSVATVSGATSYTWTLPNGWSGTSTTNSINTTAGNAGGTISVTANNSCGSSAAQTLAVSISSGSPTLGVISGSSPVCSGSANAYSVVDVGATSYTWTLPNGWSGTSTTASINTTAGNTGGDISVVANGSCGTSSPQTLTITVETAPATPGTISGSNTICSGSTNAYSVTTVSGATSYTWTLPNGWSGSSTTESISATANTSGGNVMVTADNNCGSSSPQSLTVTVETAPATPGTISGPTSICSGSSNLYSVAAVSGATDYTWTLPGAWSGSSTSESINTTADATGGNISITANNNCGSSAAQILSVTVNALPSVVFDFTQNPVCQGSSAITLSGTPLGGTFSGQGVVSGTFDPSVLNTGTYVVTYDYTDGNTCSASDTSAIEVTTCTGAQGVNVLAAIEIYPNPASDKLIIRSSSFTEQSIAVEIFDFTGRKVYVTNATPSANTITLSVADLAKGIYSVRLSEWSRKFVRE